MRHLVLVSSLVLGLLAAGPAAAQLAATHIKEGQILYVGTKAEWARINLPRTLNMLGRNYGSGPATSPIDGENQITGWGYGGGFGLVMPPGKTDLGRNLRLEFSGGWFSGDSRSDTSTIQSPDAFVIMYADGSGSGGGAPTGVTVQTFLDYDTWNVDMLVRTDFGDVEGVTLSPFLGVAYSRENRWDKLRVEHLSGNNTHVDQEMDTDYAGLVLGSSVYVPLVGDVKISLTGRADLMGADVHGTTTQSSTSAPPFPPKEIRASEREFNFSARLGGSAGLNVPVGPVLLALEGFGSWQSWAPQAAYAAPAGGDAPFRLTGDTLWSWGGRARVEIVF